MKSTNFKKIVALILCVMLVAAPAVMTIGCKGGDEESPETTEGGASGNKVTVVGKGSSAFTFKVVDHAGNETVFTVCTDKKTVGEALIENELIEGDEGDFGLYVKKVNGILADYELTRTYWAFYINGEYAVTGVDKTDIENGAEYSFKIEK